MPKDLEYLDKVSVRVNVRLIVTLLVICVVLAGGAVLSRRYFQRRNAESLMETANDLRDQGDTAKAIRSALVYLRLRPNDHASRKKVAEWIDETATTDQRRMAAYQLMADYVSSQPNDREARIKLLSMAVKLERYGDALRDHLGKLESEVGKDTQITNLIGLCYLQQGQFTAAAGAYAALIDLQPANADGYLALLQIIGNTNASLEELGRVESRLRSGLRPGTEIPGDQADEDEEAPDTAEGDPEEPTLPPREKPTSREVLANVVFARMEQNVQPIWKYLITRAGYLARRDQTREARQLIAKALEEFPQEQQVLLAGVRVALSENQQANLADDTAGAKTAISEGLLLSERGLALEEPLLEFYEQRGGLFLQSSDPKSAIEVYREGLKVLRARVEQGEYPDPQDANRWQFSFQWGIANSLLAQSLDATAEQRAAIDQEIEKIVADLNEINVRSALIEFLEARKVMAARQWRQAIEKFEAVRPNLGQFKDAVRSLDYSLLECYARLENPDARIRVLVRATTEDPLWQSGRVLLAGVYDSIGLEEEALLELNKALSVGSVPASVVRLIIRQQLRRPAEDRDWTGVETALSRLEELNRKDLAVQTMRAELLFQQQNYSGADEFLAAARSDDPDSLTLTQMHVLLTLARTDMPQVERVKVAGAIVKEFEDKAGDSLDVRLMKGDLAVAQEGKEARDTILQLAEPSPGISDESQGKLLTGLAELASGSGLDEVAQNLWEQALKLEPGNVGVLLRLADLANRREDDARLAVLLGQVRELEGDDGPNGSFLHAVSLMRKARDIDRGAGDEASKQRDQLMSQAVELLKKTLLNRSLWAEAHRLLGLAYSDLGLSGEAYSEITRAFDYGDRDQDTQQFLVDHLFREGRDAEVLQLITRIEKSGASVLPDEVRRRGAVAAFRLRMWDDALKRVGTRETADISELLFQAQVRMARGDTGEELEGILKEATDLAPERSHAWYLRVSYYNDHNRTAEAMDVIREAEERVPAEPSAVRHLTLGICYEVMNDFERAEAEFAKSHDGRTEESRAIYEHVNFYLRRGRLGDSQRLLSLLLDPQSKITREQRIQATRLRAQLQAANAKTYSEFNDAMEILGGGKPLDQTSSEDLRAQLIALSRSQIRRDLLRQLLIYEVLTRRRETSLKDQLRMAQISQEAGRWSQAIALYRSLIVSDSQNPEVPFSLISGAMPRLRIAPENNLLRDVETAVELLDRIEPGSFRATHSRAQLLAYNGDVPQAVELLNGYLSGIAKIPALDVFSTLLQSGRSNYTMVSLRSRIDPERDKAVADTLTQLQQQLVTADEPAVRKTLGPYLETAEIRAIMLTEMIRLVGISLEDLGDLDAAEQTILTYVRRSQSPDAPLLLASFKARHRTAAEAIEIIQSQEGKVSDLTAARCYVSTVRVAAEISPKQNELVAARLKALSDRNEEVDSRNAIELTIADLHIFNAQYSQAIEVYQRVLASEPGNTVALNNLAWLLSFDQNLRSTALQLVERAIEIGGPIPALVDTLGQVYINLEQPRKAMEILQKGIDESPTATLWFHLAIAQEQLGQHADALKSLEQARASGFVVDSLASIERIVFKGILTKLLEESL